MDKSRIRKEAVENLQTIIKMEETLRESRDFKEAQTLYSEWITKYFKFEEDGTDLRKELALAFNNRGQLKYLGVDFDGAVQDYSQALELDANLSSSYYNRGTIFYRMGYFDKAIKDLRIATELSPETEDFKTGLEQCQLELNKGS